MKPVTLRITASIRRMDTVARFGGDEFVVLLSQLNVDRGLSISYASAVAEKIRVALAKPYLLHRIQEDNKETTVKHQCTASIGVKLFVRSDMSEEDILKFADMAMYQAKEKGRNRAVFYEPIEITDPPKTNEN